MPRLPVRVLVSWLVVFFCGTADRDSRGHKHQHKNHHRGGHGTGPGAGSSEDGNSDVPNAGGLEETEEAKAIKDSLKGLGTLLQEAETAAKSAEDAATSWRETGSGKTLMEYEPKLHNAAKEVAKTLAAAHKYVQEQVKGLPDHDGGTIDDILNSVPHRKDAGASGSVDAAESTEELAENVAKASEKGTGHGSGSGTGAGSEEPTIDPVDDQDQVRQVTGDGSGGGFVETAMSVGPRYHRHSSYAERKERFAERPDYVYSFHSDDEQSNLGRRHQFEDFDDVDRAHEDFRGDVHGSRHEGKMYTRKDTDNFKMREESQYLSESDDGDPDAMEAHIRHRSLARHGERERHHMFADDTAAVNLNARGHAMKHRPSHTPYHEDFNSREIGDAQDDADITYPRQGHHILEEYNEPVVGRGSVAEPLPRLPERRHPQRRQASEEDLHEFRRQSSPRYGYYSRNRVPDRNTEVSEAYHSGGMDVNDQQIIEDPFPRRDEEDS